MNAHVPHQTLVTPEKPRALASGQFKVTARDVDVYYGEKQAIKKLSIDIPDRAVSAFIGPSGCGKSTFLRCINRMNDTIPTCKVTGLINVDKRDMTYLYNDGSGYIFMDKETYDQVSLSEETVGDAVNYMLENQDAVVAMHEGNPIYVELPASVVLEVTYTEPGLQGDRSSGGTKPATVETGLQIQVPLFLENGTKVRIDTRTGDYLGRVND